jgi:hypothetical protein
MLGTWVDSMYQFHPYCRDIQNPSKPQSNDLRSNIDHHQARQGDFREVIDGLRNQDQAASSGPSQETIRDIIKHLREPERNQGPYNGFTQNNDRRFGRDQSAYQQSWDLPNNQRQNHWENRTYRHQPNHQHQRFQQNAQRFQPQRDFRNQRFQRQPYRQNSGGFRGREIAGSYDEVQSPREPPNQQRPQEIQDLRSRLRDMRNNRGS